MTPTFLYSKAVINQDIKTEYKGNAQSVRYTLLWDIVWKNTIKSIMLQRANKWHMIWQMIKNGNRIDDYDGV